jgi:hypothetical protein
MPQDTPIPFTMSADFSASVDQPKVDASLPDAEIIWPPPPPADPWAHRRGEPRIFLLLWIGWLMAVTAISFGTLGPRGIVDPDEARPSTRVLLLLVIIGPALLWPAFRLCQVRPRHILRSIFLDMLVLLLPAQLVIWPQVLLAFWPIPVVGAVVVFFILWTILIGAVLALAFAAESARHPIDTLPQVSSRGIWMFVILLLSVFAPALSLLLPGPIDPLQEGPDAMGPVPLFTFSPWTAAYELTADRFWSGSSAAILPGHWAALRWLGFGAGVLWTGAATYCLWSAPRQSGPSPGGDSPPLGQVD